MGAGSSGKQVGLSASERAIAARGIYNWRIMTVVAANKVRQSGVEALPSWSDTHGLIILPVQREPDHCTGQR